LINTILSDGFRPDFKGVSSKRNFISLFPALHLP